MSNKNNGWNFLNTCTSEQLYLLKEVLFISDKKRISIDLTDRERKRMERKTGKAEIIKALSGNGNNISYTAYLKNTADILKIKNNVHGNSLVEYENVILLYCLKQSALKNPKFFKNNYNLAASVSSTQDIVEELEVRFKSSPALRISLPVVLTAIYTSSLSLSKVSKDVIDDRLKVLGALSSFGTYKIASLATAYTIGAAFFGPIGLLAVDLYKLLSSGHNDQDNIIPVTCVLIMLRRQSQDVVSDRYAASDVVNKLMSDSISATDEKDIAIQKSIFLLAFFLKMLKKKDNYTYKNVSKLFSGVNDAIEKNFIKINEAIVKPLLPFTDYLVERFYPLLFPKENIVDYNKFAVDAISQNEDKSCLVQGFVPGLMNKHSNKRFYIATSDKAIVALCLELMECKYSDICLDVLPQKEKFDIAIIKDKKFQNIALQHLYHDGKCVCFMSRDEGHSLSVEDKTVKQLKEENKKLMQQLEEYRKKELFWKNATHSFRHSHMTHFIGSIRKSVFYLKKQYNVEQNFQNIDDTLNEMSMYVEQFGKAEICQCDIWQLLQDVFEELKSHGILVVWKNVCETKPQTVELMPHIFKEWVLENIRSNIYTHAFPHTERKECIVWITLREQENSFVIEICNNGEPFKGNQCQIFQKGKFFGDTGHTGLGMYYAKMYMDEIQNKGSIEMMPFSGEYSIGFKILISKKQNGKKV